MAGMKERAVGAYYRLAHRWPLNHVHDALRRRKHLRRYGVDCAFMFHAVELEVNSMCNRKCSYCPNSSAKRPRGHMSEELFRKIVGELAEIDFDGRISYHFYGEPLLDKRLPEFVKYTKERVPKCFIEINSNGDFLDLQLFRDYVGRGLDNFLITQHDNVMPANLQGILDQASEEERKHLTIRFARDRRLINRSGLIEHLTHVNEPLRVPCDWPLSIVVVTWEGNVVLCCNDYFESEVMGNLAAQSIREVWTGPRFTYLREALARGNRGASPLCHKCDYVPAAGALSRIVPSPGAEVVERSASGSVALPVLGGGGDAGVCASGARRDEAGVVAGDPLDGER